MSFARRRAEIMRHEGGGVPLVTVEQGGTGGFLLGLLYQFLVFYFCALQAWNGLKLWPTVPVVQVAAVLLIATVSGPKSDASAYRKGLLLSLLPGAVLFGFIGF